MTSQDSPLPSDPDFDAALRASHASALTHMSARTRAQLRQRLRATLVDASSIRRSRHWQLATAIALSIALASGLAWRLGALRAADPSRQIARGSADKSQPLSVMDETPDLYVWLASDDADRLASE
jgi:hypothetical protein